MMKRKSDEAIIAKTSLTCTSMYTSFLPSVKYFPEAKQTKIPWLAKMTMYISTSKAYFGSQINQTPKIVIVFKYTLLVQKIELPC